MAAKVGITEEDLKNQTALGGKSPIVSEEEAEVEVDNFEDFKTVLENKTGFISAYWDGTIETESKIKELTKATIRCIPYNSEKGNGTCVFSGKPSQRRVLFAKAY